MVTAARSLLRPTPHLRIALLPSQACRAGAGSRRFLASAAASVSSRAIDDQLASTHEQLEGASSSRTCLLVIQLI